MSHPETPYHPAGRRPMSRGARIAWIVVGAFAVAAFCTVSAIALAAHAVATSPMLRVQVTEHTGERMHLDVRIPAAVVSAGLVAAPWFVPDEAWDEMQVELRRDLRGELDELPPHVRPALADLVRSLSTLPDATLVEVEDGLDHVRVSKQGHELRVTVRSPDADVDVTLPLALAERVADFVEG